MKAKSNQQIESQDNKRHVAPGSSQAMYTLYYSLTRTKPTLLLIKGSPPQIPRKKTKKTAPELRPFMGRIPISKATIIPGA